MKETRLRSTRRSFSRIFHWILPRCSQSKIGQTCWWRWGCAFSAETWGKAASTQQSTASRFSADFCKLTRKGSTPSTYCIPVLTFILNIPQWNPFFKHVMLSCTVPSVTQMCRRRLKAAYHRLPANKSVSSTVRAPGGIWQWVSITLSHNTVENLPDVSEEWNHSAGDCAAPLIAALQNTEHNPTIRTRASEGPSPNICGTALCMCVSGAHRQSSWKILCELNCSTETHVQHLECFLHWKGNHGMKITVM